MAAKFEPLITALKAAREARGLSQRALGDRVGIPQSHISKIESGSVDLQISSLIELARALGLELTLLPRSAIPTARALSARTTTNPLSARLINRELHLIAKRARELAPRFPQTKAIEELLDTAVELQHMPLGARIADDLHRRTVRINETLRLLSKRRGEPRQASERFVKELEVHAKSLRDLRNAAAHRMTDTSDEPRPAYRLPAEEDSDVR